MCMCVFECVLRECTTGRMSVGGERESVCVSVCVTKVYDRKDGW